MRSKKVLARGNGKCKGLEPSEPGIFKEEQESPCGWSRMARGMAKWERSLKRNQKGPFELKNWKA